MRSGVAVLALLAPVLSGCSGNQGADADRQALLKIFEKTLAQPYTFTDTDTDLKHTATVSGTIADAYRHSVLLLIDGHPQWQEIVKDDAVADYFPDTDAVATYSGAGSSDYVDATGATSAAPQTITPAAPLPGAPSASASPGTVTTVTAGSELPAESSSTTVVAALKAGQWVLDPAGAPAPVSQSTSMVGLRENPFYEALLALENGRQSVLDAPMGGVKRYQKDNLFPIFKPSDDPFPAPGSGETRYDVLESPVPGVALGTTTPAPLDAKYVTKVAVYVRNGYVVQVRLAADPTDRLQTIAALYKVDLPAHLTTAQEESLGEMIVNKVQGSQAPPYRVHSETLTLSFIGTPSPITLPASYVRGPLNLFPLHGAKAPAPVPSS